MGKANASFELDQTIVLLSDLNKKFNDPSKIKELTAYDLMYLHNVYERIRQLSSDIFGSPKSFDAWVGPMRQINEEQDKVQRADSEITERLFNFVQGFRHSKNVERIAQENVSLRAQLSELQKRESTYRAIIEKAKTPTSPDSRKVLLESLRLQEKVLVKQLSELKLQKAKHDPIRPPLDILRSIEQIEIDLEQIRITYAELEKQE